MRQPEVPEALSPARPGQLAGPVLLEALLLRVEGFPEVTLYPGERPAAPVGRMHGPWLHQPRVGQRADMTNRRAEQDGEFQSRAVELYSTDRPRTAEEIEAEYIFGNRCECHFWEVWRCHLIQSRAARRPVTR